MWPPLAKNAQDLDNRDYPKYRFWMRAWHYTLTSLIYDVYWCSVLSIPFQASKIEPPREGIDFPTHARFATSTSISSNMSLTTIPTRSTSDANDEMYNQMPHRHL